MANRLLAIAPVNLEIGGRVYSIEAGSSIQFTTAEVQQVLAGPYAGKFKVIYTDMPETDISIHSQGLPVFERPQVAPPILTAHKDWATPYAPGTQVDPIVTLPQAPQDFFVAPALNQPEPPDGVSLEPANEDLPERVVLAPDTHWSKVKAHLLVLEAQEPVDYAEVREIKDKFPTYIQVQIEADRILQQGS